ncbi:MAG: patatin-like phospholipase family protein [Deltaproteobacteria bacterium]|nr:patatin-like phospholipase family protein [Deltaproteobacteria bacterium]
MTETHPSAEGQTLTQWLAQGPYTLAMSSGFFGFYAHTGFLKAIEERGLLPERACGSSAGALVAGSWSAGLDADEITRILCDLKRADFWDPRLGPGLLRGDAFRALLEAILPVATFDACDHSLAMSAVDLKARTVQVLDHGDLAAAIHASCAVPGMFHPVRIQGRLLVDGGVLDRPGLAGAPKGARILAHHLASKSPWRLRAPQAPSGPHLVALVLDDLPRVGPFHLEHGAAALDRAYRATQRALDMPITSGVIRLSA